MMRTSSPVTSTRFRVTPDCCRSRPSLTHLPFHTMPTPDGNSLYAGAIAAVAGRS